MTPAQLKIWLGGRRKNNSWLSLPEVQAIRLDGGPEAFVFLVKALQALDQPLYVREGAAYLLGELGDIRAVEPLIAALRENMTPLHEEIFQALNKFEPVQTLQTLSGLLKEPDWQTRKYSAFALGRLEYRGAVGPLISSLEDENDEVVDFVVRALAKHGDRAAVEPLIRLLEPAKEVRPHLKATAAWGLSFFKDARAVPVLLKALSSTDPKLRANAAKALGDMGESQAIELLGPLVKDSDWYVRSETIRALGRIGGKEAIPPLLEALQDSEPAMRMNAIIFLGYLGDESVLPALEWHRNYDDGQYRLETIKDIAKGAIKKINQKINPG